MQIYIYKNNEQFGPFSLDQIETYLNTNVFEMNDFAWLEGESDWITLNDLLIKQSNLQGDAGVSMSPRPAKNEAPQEAQVKILTTKIAEQFLKDDNSVDLSFFDTIEDSAAQTLANYNDCLELNGLVILSATAARALAQHNGGLLSFDALTSLSDASALELSEHRGILFLNGLTSLGHAAAQSLAQHRGWLSLNGLTNLSDEAAQALAQHSGPSDPASLSLNGLRNLSNAAALALAQHQGGLELNGLCSLSATIAKALAQHHSGWLSLSALKLLSDDSAIEIAQHRGSGLDLSGLTNLSEHAAKALKFYQRKRSLMVTKFVKSLLDKDIADSSAKEWALNAKDNINKTQAQAQARDLAEAEAKSQAQAQAQAQAQSRAHAEAKAQTKLQLAQVRNRSEAIKSSFIVLFFIVTPLIGIFLLFVAVNTGSSSCVIAGLLALGLPILGLFFLAALDGNSDPKQRNAQIAMIQRQKMIDKLNEIRNESNEY